MHYKNAFKHLGSRGHYAAYQWWAYGLPYDEESWFVRTAGNQRRRRYEWRARMESIDSRLKALASPSAEQPDGPVYR